MKNKLEIQDLNARAIEISTRFHRAETELISVLQDIDGHPEFHKL